jgi:hypothetical protein
MKKLVPQALKICFAAVPFLFVSTAFSKAAVITAPRIELSSTNSQLVFKLKDGSNSGDLKLKIYWVNNGELCSDSYKKSDISDRTFINQSGIPSDKFIEVPFSLGKTDLFCVRASKNNDSGEKFSDIFLTRSVQQSQTNSITLIYKSTETFSALDHSNNDVKKSIVVNFYFPEADGVKYTNLDVSNVPDGEADRSIAFYQAYYNTAGAYTCEDKNGNRENQFVPFTLISNKTDNGPSEQKINKIFNIPVYPAASNPASLDSNHYLCLFQWASGLHYSFVSNKELHLGSKYPGNLIPTLNQCIGTILISRVDNNNGWWVPYWDATNYVPNGECSRTATTK